MEREAEQTRPQPEARALIGRLYQAYNPRCYRAALALLGVPHLAEEAVQETWLKAVRLAETAPAQEVERQLFTILKNTALDLRRRERRYAPLPEGWDAPGGTEAEGGADFRALVELIRALPERYRRVLELKYLGEYGNREIARRLGVKESTVATQIQRGRKLLLDAWKREGY